MFDRQGCGSGSREGQPPPAGQRPDGTAESQFTALSAPLVSGSCCPRRQARSLQAVWITATGHIETAVLLPTDPRLAVMGLIAYGSSTTLAKVDLLASVALTPRLSMWTTSEITGWPNLRATKIACALGHCRDIVHGTAVFTGALDTTNNPIGLTAAQTVSLRDLT